MTSRDLVKATLEFENRTERAPRQMWFLPWAEQHCGEVVNRIHTEFPDDIVSAPTILPVPTVAKGDMYVVGESTDDWGCKFVNIHEGIIGEVKESLIKEDDWSDWEEHVHIPTELLDFDVNEVNTFCKNTDKFVLSGCCPRPFEQMQFIRTTVELYMDLMDPEPAMLKFMDKMFAYYCELMEKWAKTDVDGLMFMDDWGSQNGLLINPTLWDKYYRPFYKEFIDIAHRNGKKAFMHSDGNTLAIYPKLIDLGLDAFNSQIFCMGVDKLEEYKGKITFWGEIDRQHLLPEGSQEDIVRAVNTVKERLWDNGGCIAQCEFGPGAKPENVYKVFETWNKR